MKKDEGKKPDVPDLNLDLPPLPGVGIPWRSKVSMSCRNVVSTASCAS